jgi:hypothetical protein
LLGDEIGVVDEVEKISSNRCRKFAGRSTITLAGGGARCGHSTSTGIKAGGTVVQAQSAAADSSVVSLLLLCSIANPPFHVRPDGRHLHRVVLLGLAGGGLQASDLGGRRLGVFRLAGSTPRRRR